MRKATISFLMSVRLSAWNNSALTGRIFIKFDIWIFFENFERKFKFHSNRTRITDTLHVDHCTSLIISHSVLLGMGNVSGIKTYVFSKILPFMRQYEKNIVQPDRPQMTTWGMCSACWIHSIWYRHSLWVTVQYTGYERTFVTCVLNSHPKRVTIPHALLIQLSSWRWAL